MINRARWAVLALAAGLTVAACSSGAAATQPPNLEGTKWRVVEIAGAPTYGANPPTVSFGKGRIRGDSGCNTFSANLTLDQTTIDVGSINSTLRLCEGDVGAIETQFMRALVGATSFAFDEEGNLVLDGTGGEVQLIASR
jgi:heat shock protein HslJ